jgi:hypothetical protein
MLSHGAALRSRSHRRAPRLASLLKCSPPRHSPHPRSRFPRMCLCGALSLARTKNYRCNTVDAPRNASLDESISRPRTDVEVRTRASCVNAPTEGACIKGVKARIERGRRAQQAHRKEARTRGG